MLPPRHQKAAKRSFWIYWPRRILSDRGAVAMLMLLALILMLASQIAPSTADRSRAFVFDRLSTFLGIITIPTQKLSSIVEHMTGISNMSSDLAHLREENTKLKQWYDRAKQLEAENKSLRALVRLADLPRTTYTTARIIAESGGAFAQSIIIDAGTREGVTQDSVAMTGDGVIGRVMSASGETSHILLLTDVNSRIPVVIENSRHRGVIAGDNTSQPKLLYLPDDAAVSVGERVLTSGHGGIFAPGLPVGVIVSVEKGHVRVQPFADLRRLDFVQTIDFGRDTMATMPVPPTAKAKTAP